MDLSREVDLRFEDFLGLREALDSLGARFLRINTTNWPHLQMLSPSSVLDLT